MWQDNEIRFDISPRLMKPRLGERVIDQLESIEDTKGNAGERGRMLITNLRVIWHCLTFSRINLSIGFGTFITIATKTIESMHNGVSQSLLVMGSFRNCRYEFIFTNLDTKSSRHYTSVIGVYRAYMSSKIFREIKLRGGIILNKRLTLLPGENLHTTLPGVWNLSTEQGNVGTFIVTNLRIVWYADMNYQFNVSLPFLAVASINIKSSKFGPTLVIVSNDANGGYILGFRVDPVQQLHVLHKELNVLYTAFNQDPNFGVEYTFEFQATSEPELPSENTEDNQEGDDEISNVLGMYMVEGSAGQRRPVFSNHLGLAVEETREGTSLQALWELLPTA